MKIATNAVLTKVMTMMESVILKMMKQLGVALLFSKKIWRAMTLIIFCFSFFFFHFILHVNSHMLGSEF
jgi:hypothetical protein